MGPRSIETVVLSVADLALVIVGFLTFAMIHQKTEFRHAAARLEDQRDSALADRDSALREVARAQAMNGFSEKGVSQELLGIRGSLHKLVFVVDKSGSMGRGRKWEYTRGIIDTFLRYLPIERCSLVVFDDRVELYPVDGSYLDVGGPGGAQNRELLLARLGELSPGGNTNTIAALESAYALDPTAIILATDGFPDRGGNRFDTKMADTVEELCRKQGRAVPVHVLALGDYFQPRLGRFLWNITYATGGSFIAR